jgi:hypothetical protein
MPFAEQKSLESEAIGRAGLASFALLQLIHDAPELLQRCLQALDDLG